MGQLDDKVLDLSKDIGKVSERTGRLEEGFGRFERKMDDFMSGAEARDKAFGAALEKIDDHMGQVCAFARLCRFLLKFVLPPGGLLALAGFARAMGWL